MEENVDKIKAHVHWSLYLCSRSINEMLQINSARTEEEVDIVAGDPFEFYKVSLQYCFIMEFTKLLESRNSNNDTDDKNVASLLKLNQALLNKLGNEFKEIHSANELKVYEIRSSPFFDIMKDLRDQKYGHADGSDINKPMKIEFFSNREIDKAIDYITRMSKIYQNITGFNVSVGLGLDNQTAVFIKQHAVYQKYYLEKFPKPYLEGYKI